MKKSGFIGLGAMGAHMARNLAKAGYLHSVWNRTSSKAEALAGELAVVCATDLKHLVADVDIVFLCVSADQDVLGLITTLAEILPAGSVVVDMSTVSRETALLAAEMLSVHGVHFLDAPVSGGVEGAKNASLAMMLGGDKQILEYVADVLAAMTRRIEHMGPVGSGQATKAVNQIMAAGINQAVTEALAFAQAQDLPMSQLIDVVSSGAAGNWFLQHRGLSMTEGRFEPGFKLALHHKDLRICQQMAKKTAVSTELLDKTVRDYEQLMQQGYGEEDISALYRIKPR